MIVQTFLGTFWRKWAVQKSRIKVEAEGFESQERSGLPDLTNIACRCRLLHGDEERAHRKRIVDYY